jgi:hypothetical protein
MCLAAAFSSRLLVQWNGELPYPRKLKDTGYGETENERESSKTRRQSDNP